MNYLSVCSGIEAATVAWHPLGWTPFGFAEIEKFPSSVLAHHYGSNMPDELWKLSNGVPNFGDLNNFKEWPDAPALDILVGGTPCQSFSVAGLRKGLADPRGNLCLTYLAIADRYRPEWLVWENVPGVLSSGDGRDFGAFLGGLAELGYGWAYRVLDAQYVRVDGFDRAVPQRRRRVFVVGHLGDWRRAAAVLFERESMSGHPAPRRQAGEGIAPTISSRPTGGGGLGTDFDCDGGLVAGTLGTRSAHHPSGVKSEADFLVARALNAHPSRSDGESETFVAHPLLAKGNSSHDDSMETYVAHSLRADGFDASEDGTGRQNIIPIDMRQASRGEKFTNKRAEGSTGGAPGTGIGKDGDPSPTIASSHIPAIAIQERAVCENPDAGPDGAGFRADGASYTLEARSVPQAVATAWAVRRLMPIECERLQGFPDGYTVVPFRGKPAADGPRYKALGNSMAVNAMRWLGRRIELVSSL